MKLHRLRNRVRRLLYGRSLPTWYDARYRLPMATAESRLGIEPRRADFALSYLLDSQVIRRGDVQRPSRIGYDHILRVHSRELVASLHEPATLSNVFGVHEDDVHVDEMLWTVRLACGGTLAASQEALRRAGPTMNLLGGFHHASKTRGAGLCPINDIAIAIAALRADGFEGQVNVLDLDAHPPDGTADCLRDDDHAYIGSLSGSDWGPIPNADETVLPEGAGDGTYLVALADLLLRMPPASLTFVIAGGDVLAGDRLGALGLTLEGARRRDAMVADAIDGASVWLPGGGYNKRTWRVLAGTALAILGSEATIPEGYDSIEATFGRIRATLPEATLTGGEDLALDDVLSDLGTVPRTERFLGFYTESGIEHALEQYGILGHLRRLGYRDFRVEVAQPDERSRCRLYAKARGVEHLLVECVLERRTVGSAGILYVHWLTLRDGARELSSRALPGQERPGLGMAREVNALMAQIAMRLGLEGVGFTPSWCHMAFLARERAQFADAARQGRFEALARDLGHLPTRELSAAVEQGRVLMNGEPYEWEATDMVAWREGPRLDEDEVARERARVRFTLRAVATDGDEVTA